ncbi:ParB/RepB/Spo0J family partition protein [Microvirga lotononidis]|uniref:ParB-like nuclease n=1 Tax=Microvirga lotononidis TaxID=864069 RepID=I4Z2L5_9HYPH|nr:ParB/RepB/Spo0J family partition protein [Microvirga lotononidis]EIM30457.1 ParB-like nuclease [Microvirga lotononidis]WQO26298.1 ParB/RepB/Spo0J family partition protein [Microvirga lotononidis]
MIQSHAEYRTITTHGYPLPTSPHEPGPAPQLQWIEINQLVVDPSYQRDIGKKGRLNVNRIVEGFEWSKFAPVVVAPLEGGLFAIVDGQHRTTAALLRGIEKVLCQIVYVDRAKQAEAYAAVNGNVTKTTPQQLFHAKLAARDKAALAVAEICAAGGVEIIRGNFSSQNPKPGRTQAIGAITRCFDRYGRDTVITALQCITQTGDGNPGQVRATIIEALCDVLHSMPIWRDAGEALLRALDDFDFADMWESIISGRNFVLSPAVQDLIAERIRHHLSLKLSDENKEAA